MMTKMNQTAVIYTGARKHEVEVRRSEERVWVRQLRDMGNATTSVYDALPFSPLTWRADGWASLLPTQFAARLAEVK
jgi:hypothetical protein